VEENKSKISEMVGYVMQLYGRRILVFYLSLSCICLGVRWIVFRPGGTLRGVVASFLLVLGIQIALWFVGIRTELLGTSPDPTAAEELDYEAKTEKLRLLHTLADSEREITELKTKLSQSSRRVDVR
jgi:hypothetical protein